MPVKKSELYASLWKSCDELRGGMDASQYKDYVLMLLFIKYISDKYAGVAFATIVVPEGASFKDLVALKNKPTIGDDINKKIIGPIAQANKLSLSAMPDFNNPDKLGSGRDMVQRLSNLITIFEDSNLDFSKNRAEGDDILGDAYEFLMRNFATESGKSKGQFYTPAEVSRIIAKIVGIDNANTTSETTAYDPTCGSGSLLLKVADEADTKISLYGQEMENATAALARMNMIIHDNPTAVIEQDNTLSNPKFRDRESRLRLFDFAVSNPPFSYKSWSNGLNLANDEFGRFDGYGIPPSKNGDYAFLLHILRSLNSKGKGCVILPHGVLFRGNVEAEIRENIIKKGYIKGIVSLPANLFFGTGIPACIIVLDKENAQNRKGIFMVDASKGFYKDGNKNRLREQDIHLIVDTFKKGQDVEKYARMVSFDEIEGNEYNLNIPRYIDSQEEDDVQNIDAHLQGGIPQEDIDALGDYWKVYPTLKKTLFTDFRPGFVNVLVASDEIKTTIFSHPEFTKYSQKVDKIYQDWKSKNRPKLDGISIGDKPKKLIHEISEDLLFFFSNVELIDKYDVYQHLMTYWFDTMQDDIYGLVVDGWESGRVIDIDKKQWEGRFIPKALIVSRYFQAEQDAINTLESERDGVAQELTELEEEHGGDDGVLNEARNEKDKITKASVNAQLKKADDIEEIAVLKKYLELADLVTALNRRIKDANNELNKKLLEKYPELSVDEIKSLVIDDKWLAVLEKGVKSEMDRISQRLATRIKELADRYGVPVGKMSLKVDELSKRVDDHLKKMGFTW